MSDILGMSEAQVLDCIRKYTHWPMECSLTPAALAFVESAVRDHIKRYPLAHKPGVALELANLVSNIRSHLQHVVAEAKQEAAENDPLLR